MVAMDVPPPIGRKIKKARERMRWSQQRLADAIGVTQKTIDNWEHDRSYPRSAIGALEEALGVSLDAAEPEPEPEPEPDPEPPVNPDRDKSVEELLNKVDERLREIAVLHELVRQKRRNEGEADGGLRRRRQAG